MSRYQKTDARNIVITYAYDQINRNTTVDYSNTAAINPDITRIHDNSSAGANGKGRFWHDYAGGNYTTGQNVEHKSIDSYDAMGRPLSVRQHFKLNYSWSNGFTTSQTYDLAGNVKTITYPSGRVVNYAYNSAGQMTSFTGKLGGLTGAGGADVNYATGMQYNPRGQMTRETFGTNTLLYQRKHYNRRGQLFDIRLGTDGSSAWDVEDPQVWQWANGSWNRGAIRLFHSAGLNDYSGPNPVQADNNGNIHRTDHFVPNAVDGGGNITSWVMGTDAYRYDELNRLTQVTETPTGGTGPGFTQKFIYDRWGNRRIDLAATSNVGGGVTRIDFKVLTANNRLVAAADTTGDENSGDQMRYDQAGNLVYDNYSPPAGQRGGMVYDAENRMTSAVNGYHLYRYDADGKRTRKLVTGSPELWLVYGVNGELVAEYDAVIPGGTLKKEYGYRGGQMLVVYDAGQSGDNRLKWVVTDHLGSTRMLVNRSGGLCGAIERLDYLPFGEELASTIGHRNATCSGYGGGNSLRQKLTGKERDSETGLDYYGARYFASVQGRFTSPDEPLIDQYRAYPQSWNLYTYVLSNPLRYIDPTGQWHTDAEGNVIGDYNGECIENGACWNEERQLWELPEEPPASFAEQIIEFRDPFLEKVFINELVKEVSRDIKPGIIDVIPVVGGLKKLENAAKIVGRFGVVGGSRYRKAIKILQRAGTHKELNGVVPTREEAEKMIIEAGGKIKRIERAHKSGTGHDFDHINYETASGEKATVRVESVSRQYYAPGEGKFKDNQ